MNQQQNPWFPVAQSTDLVPRHVFHGQLQGVELALWRDDQQQVNAWENRCPHRSVRFTLGVNMGSRLRCQYHGWQYQAGDGRCTLIPAASNSTPPASLCAQPYAVREQDGFIWIKLQPAVPGDLPAPSFAPFAQRLRSLPFHAPLAEVRQALAGYALLDPQCVVDSLHLQQTEHELQLTWRSGEQLCQVRFYLQPASARRTIVHSSTADLRLGIDEVRWHNRLLTDARRRLENSNGVIARSHTEDSRPAATSPGQRRDPQHLEATVVERWNTASEILGLKLALPADSALNFEAGAHIDLHTPSGHVRQYSLVNAPDEREQLVLGIKLEEASRGGSRSLHEQLKAGDRLRISQPKNHFRLVPERAAILIAGGIGITPLLAMGAAAQACGQAYELHYFVRSEAHVAFPERLHRLRHNCIHTGLSPEQTGERLRIVLQQADPQTQLYVCGPKVLIDVVSSLAREAGWNDADIHFELFANTVSHAQDRPFDVRLQRSGAQFTVPAGVSLADCLKAHGIAVDTSCEQGVCGTCRTEVIDGEPDHRDVCLSRGEQQSNRCLMPCVSRSKSELLVLDL
ncbi:Rieske 2Fe-2S domain-containing protein [Pseudomonas sp. Pse1]|uniref:Rieske 2Fe-2S domain-containing protein n=1 Tax=Pseudomonas sp. Pse1 TaxID=2926020 RepID=UPI00211990E7|nr:Rieske 2Fe-2S domain-containing protein [Pseudomonas sp. Pse1]